MPKAILVIIGIVAGLAAAIVGAIAAELFSAVVHPFPEGFDGSTKEMNEHVARYPHWVLAIVVPIWGFAAFLGTWIARRIGGLVPAIVVAILLVAAVILNISLLPYPIWFEIVIVLAVLATSGAGCWQIRRSTNPPALVVDP